MNSASDNSWKATLALVLEDGISLVHLDVMSIEQREVGRLEILGRIMAEPELATRTAAGELVVAMPVAGRLDLVRVRLERLQQWQLYLHGSYCDDAGLDRHGNAIAAQCCDACQELGSILVAMRAEPLINKQGNNDETIE